MNDYATKHEMEEIAEAYCERIGAKYLFVADDCSSFGCEMNGMFAHLSFYYMGCELGIIDEEKDIRSYPRDIARWIIAERGLSN